MHVGSAWMRLSFGFFLLSLLVLIYSFSPEREKTCIRLVFFGDTENSDIARSISQEKVLFETRIPCLLSSKSGVRVKTYFFCGADFNRENLDNINQLFYSRDDDIIFFYYSGHGSNDSLSSFPRLAVRKQNGDRKSKYLDEVYFNLKHKPHRLLVVAGEACNTHSRSRMAQVLDKNYRDSLLMPIKDNEQGINYIISSSKQGQDSHACRGEAGYFTLALLDVLNEVDTLNELAVIDYLERWKERTIIRAASVEDVLGKRVQEPFWVAER